MTDVATTSAQSGAVAISLAIMAKLNAGPIGGPHTSALPLPEQFDALPLDALLAVLYKIAALSNSPVHLDAPVPQNRRIADAIVIDPALTCAELSNLMDAAHRILSSWPRSMDSVFSALADRNRNAKQLHPVFSLFATEAGYKLLSPVRAVDGPVIPLIDNALDDWLFRERGIYRDARRRVRLAQAGDVTIDAADALRRLEGRTAHPLAITAWSAAGAVKFVGEKVSLNSVEVTVAAMARLACDSFDDSMSVEDWSTRFAYNQHYKRADAIRDVLSGKIRVQQVKENHASRLASLLICRSDFLRRATLAQAKANTGSRQADQARRAERYWRPGQIQTLLAQLWPGRDAPRFAEHPGIRCRTTVRRYFGREMMQRLYSVADVLDVMEAEASRDLQQPLE